MHCIVCDLTHTCTHTHMLAHTCTHALTHTQVTNLPTHLRVISVLQFYSFICSVLLHFNVLCVLVWTKYNPCVCVCLCDMHVSVWHPCHCVSNMCVLCVLSVCAEIAWWENPRHCGLPCSHTSIAYMQPGLWRPRKLRQCLCRVLWQIGHSIRTRWEAMDPVRVYVSD